MIKPNYSCTAAILASLAGAVLFRPHVLKTVPSSATATRSVLLQEATPEQKIHLAENFGKLPLSFEANKGQTEGRVKFLSRGRGYGLFLTSSEAVLALHHGKSKAQKSKGQINDPRFWGVDPKSQSLSVLRLKLVGANPAIEITGLEELPGKSNYFIDNDPKVWRTDVPNFAKVQYKNVYSRVDLIYYGNQRQLEYDWVIGPGADLSAIQFSISGAQQIRLDSQGDLVIQTGDSEVRFQKPVVYQQQFKLGSPQSTPSSQNRDSKFDTRQSSLITRHLLEGQYVLRGKRGIGFEVVSYDRSEPLIIDPVLVYSTYLGGSANDEGFGIVVDSAGNAYVTGDTKSPNFPTASPIQAAFGGGIRNAFVTKLNAAGNALVYSTYLGGSGDDSGSSIAVDSSGNAYVTGSTSSTNFPTVNPFQATNHGFLDAFVAKLNSVGSAFVYSTYLGGGGDDFGAGIAVDSAGNAYLTGSTKSTNFPTAGTLQATHGAASANAFVTELNAAGGALIYSTYLGGNGINNADGAFGIAVDSAGNAYVTGLAGSTDFPTVNAIQPVSGGSLTDAFVAKISPANLPGVSLTPASLSFASQALTTTSSAQTVTLHDVGSAALTISSTAATGDFAETNTCGTPLPGGANCNINVTFTPTALGTRSGNLTVTDNAAGSPHSITLSGTGSDFSLAAASGANCPSGGNCSTSATISAGLTATYNLQVSPVSGFNGTVFVTCGGAPGASTCSPSPASVPPTGSSSYAFTVTVSNTINAMVLPWPTTPSIPGFPWPRGALLLLAGIAVMLFMRRAYHTGRQTWRLLPGFAILLFVLPSFNGCGGGGGGGRPPTNATLTITGSSGSLKRTLNLSLTINH
jgi:Beta-propeller repeat